MLMEYHFYGYSGSINDTLAFHYAKKAAEGGYSDAYYMLSAIYAHGIGTQRNAMLAVKFYNDAITAKNPQALRIADIAKKGVGLGELYYKTAMAETDNVKKINYLEVAADLYHLPAIRALVMFHGAYENIDEQYYWAAAGSHIRDKECIDVLYSLVKDLFVYLNFQGLYSSEDLGVLAQSIGSNYILIDNDHEKSLPWCVRAEKLGNKRVYLSLGMIYFGESKYANPARAKEYFQKAVEHGDVLAEGYLKLMK